jgi:hypothetical protein
VILKMCSAILNSSKFLPFIKGTDITLTDGTKLTLKINTTKRVFRREGLRFSKYIFRSEIQCGNLIELGYGEDDIKILAFEKSIAEAVERVIFRLLKNNGRGTETSSGWAAHVSKANAEKAAIEELVERDTIMVHWLLRKPMIEIEQSSFPLWLTQWIDRELSLHPILNRLRILVSFEGATPTVSSILLTDLNNGVICHSTGNTLDEAIRRALSETCRLATNIDQKYFYESSQLLLLERSKKISPEDHGMLYAYHNTMPNWIFGAVQS